MKSNTLTIRLRCLSGGVVIDFLLHNFPFKMSCATVYDSYIVYHSIAEERRGQSINQTLSRGRERESVGEEE